MILIVAEKPSVARDIARCLHVNGKGNACIQNEQFCVSWALGHLVSYCNPDEIDEKYKRWSKKDLPILPEEIPTKVLPKTRSQFKVLKELFLNPQFERIICATDAGREGELIFRLIYEKTNCKKPVDRLWISSMTDAAIREGFAQLKPGTEYEGLYRSAVCRAQADWLVGMNLSRAFTLQYNALLSVGRVQTPTLAILCKRAAEIRAFVPEEFYSLNADLGDYNALWFDPSKSEEKTNHRIKTQEEAEQIAKAVTKKKMLVHEVKTEEKREIAPQLFDLTSLQRESNKALGFTATRTLKTAQSLYETRKALTYPRTDSRYLPNDMLPKLKQSFSALKEPYQGFVADALDDQGKIRYTKRVFDDTKLSDHHAIIPTPQSIDLNALSADERALYDLVVRRTLAAFYPPHVYQATRVVSLCEGHYFKSFGRIEMDLGWKKVYTDNKKTQQDDEQALPPLKVGDERTCLKTKIKKDATKAPPLHTDASLLYGMEHPGLETRDEALIETLKANGLGTPATRAAIIERLIEVQYVRRRGRALEATEKGEKLIEAAPPEIASPEMTAKWEQALEDIAKNKRDPARFMEGIRKLTLFLVDKVLNEPKDLVFEREPSKSRAKLPKSGTSAKTLEGLACPLCGKGVIENTKAFGCSGWKEGCHFTIWKNALTRVKGPVLTQALIKALLQKGELRGSSGLISLKNDHLSFTKTGDSAPSLEISINYQKA